MLVKRDRINIVEIILDLRRAPYRMKFRSIADAINVPMDTLKAWFYRSSMPDLNDGLALLTLHRTVTESCTCNQTGGEKALQHDSRTHETVKETIMARKKTQPKSLNAPGAEPQAPGQADDDAAIAAGRSGQAHKIAKPKPEVAPAKVKVLDTQRTKTMPVNQKTEMSYADAMKLHESGEQTRAILTPQGWLAPPLKTPQAAKAGVA